MSTATITVRPIPELTAPVAEQGPLDWLPRKRSAEPIPPGYVQGRLSLARASNGADPIFGPQLTDSVHLPAARPWSQNMIRACLEVIDGVRPASQVSRWVTPEVYERISRRGLLARRRRQRQKQPSVVRSVHVCEPVDGVAEIAAVVIHQNRVRAVALRMTGVDGRWQISVLQVG